MNIIKLALAATISAFVAVSSFAQTPPQPPNIIVVVVDDFSMNLLPNPNDNLINTMPNLYNMIKTGLYFKRYFVSTSLCCPSRASFLTGLLPHNTGVLTNVEPDGGYDVFVNKGNDLKTFAVALKAANYTTAFMGKYLNLYNPTTDPIPAGWDEWVSTDNGYKSFDYLLNHNGVLSRPPEHFTDLISKLGQEFIKREASNGPFLLELAPFSPHAPFTPPTRYANLYPDASYPRTPTFGFRPEPSAPDWLQAVPPLTDANLTAFDNKFRKRVQTSKGVDDMLGNIRKLLVTLGIEDNTYVIFTSDNGYHFGEYSLREGKQTPFDTDINVPLIVVGPGIVPNTITNHLSMVTDFYPTFLDLAGLPPSDTVNGHSLAPLLTNTGTITPRSMTVIEQTSVPPVTSDPDMPVNMVPSFTALRLLNSMYVEYETGEVGYYDMINDPYQLHNIESTLTPAKRARLHNAIIANKACITTSECIAAQAR